MSMRRETEFRWQPQSSSGSKFFMSLLLAGAGLATGYIFVHAGRQPMTDAPASETASGRVPSPVRSAIEEHSGVATAAPLPVQLPSSVSHFPELARDEASAIATTATPVVKARDAAFQASIERKEKPSARSATRLRRASSYATLRQALLRNAR